MSVESTGLKQQRRVNTLLTQVAPLGVKPTLHYSSVPHPENQNLLFDEGNGGTSVRRSDLSWQLSVFDTMNCGGCVFPEEVISCQASLMCRSNLFPSVGQQRLNVSTAKRSLTLKGTVLGPCHLF